MKKKLLSLLLLSALVLSMTACGGESSNSDFYVDDEDEIVEDKDKDDDKDENEDKDEDDTDKPAETETTEEVVQTTAPVTEAETTTTEPIEVKDIERYDSFVNGNFTFKVDGIGYVYCITENKMYSYESRAFGNLLVANGKLAIFETESSPALYNLETKEYIASYDVNGMKPLCSINGYTDYFREDYWLLSDYTPIYKTNDSFDGKTFGYGVVDKNGEWVIPFSSDYKVSKCTNLDVSGAGLCGLLMSMGDGDDGIYYYAPEIDEFVDDKIHNALGDESLFYIPFRNSGDEYLIINWDYYDGPAKMVKLNIKTGDYSVIYDGKMQYDDDYSIFSNEEYTFAFGIDDDFNKYEYDLSEYSVNKILCMNENYIVFSAKNPDGDYFGIFMDRNGNRVIDPIKGIGATYMNGDSIVCVGENYKKYFINLKTAEVTTKEEDSCYSIEKFDYKTGMMLVRQDDKYYLVNPADPETLINPFELAE